MRKDLLILGIVTLLVIGGTAYFASSYRSDQATVPVANGSTAAGPTRLTNESLIKPDSPSMGPENAKVTIVEFYDPECESCAAFHPILKNVLKNYDGRIRLVMRYMPLHPNSLTAATFTEAAGEQGKYWEAQELLFVKQPEWGTRHGPSSAPQESIDSLFRKYAKELALDESKVNSVFAQNKYASKVERDKKDGQALGVRQTPTLFVNGIKLGSLNEQALRVLIDAEMNR